MRAGKTPTYYWDSSVFISLLSESGRTPEQLKKLKAIERLSDNGGCNIVTSCISLIEVLACKLTTQQEDLFRSVLWRSNVSSVSVTSRIADLAREIRGYNHSRGIKLAVSDSIHVATAIQYHVDVLHTFDGSGNRLRGGTLPTLPQPILGRHPLLISIPEPPIDNDSEDELLIQNTFFDFEPDSEKVLMKNLLNAEDDDE
jgi:predicted nucleic acid-binding protein